MYLDEPCFPILKRFREISLRLSRDHRSFEGYRKGLDIIGSQIEKKGFRRPTSDNQSCFVYVEL